MSEQVPFDPDAALAQVRGKKPTGMQADDTSFDPDAALASVRQANQPSIARTLLDQPLNALTANFAPKIEAAMTGAAAALKAKDINAFGPAYTKDRDARMALSDSEESAHPWASAAGQALGALASPVNKLGGMAAELIPGENVLAAVARGGAQGAVVGGANAVGATTGDAGDYTRNALLGAAMGAGTGAAVTGAGQTVGKLAAPNEAAVDAAYDAARAAPPGRSLAAGNPRAPGLTGQASLTFNDLVNTDPDWQKAYQSASDNAVRAGKSAFPPVDNLGRKPIPTDILDATQREFSALNQQGKVGTGSTMTKTAAGKQIGDLLTDADAENPLYAAARGKAARNIQRRDILHAGVDAIHNPLGLVTAPASAPLAMTREMLGQSAANNLPARAAVPVSPVAANLLSAYLAKMFNDRARAAQ